MNRRTTVGAIIVILIAQGGVQVLAQGRHERREQRLAESANQNASADEIKKAKEVVVSIGFEKAFDVVVQVLKARGLTIESANKDVGQIKTEFQITVPEKPTQHAMRYLVDLRKVSDKEAGVKVVGLEQVRTYRLQAEPWEAPTYNADASDDLTKAIVEATRSHG